MSQQAVAAPRPIAASVLTGTSGRSIVRYVTALAAFAAGTLYLLIATGVLTVIEPAVQGEQAPIFIPIAAAAAFFLGGVLLVVFDRRIVCALGAVVQLVTVIGYFAVAPNRTPSYEVWGIVIKAIQVLILLGLVYLALTGARRQGAGR